MKSILNETSIYDYEKIITFRLYFSIISFIFCSIVIIIFIFTLIKNCIHNKQLQDSSNVSFIKEFDRTSFNEKINDLNTFISEENYHSNNIILNKNSNFNENSILGNNQIFLLIISNLLSSINTIYTSIKYPLGFQFYFDKYSTYCIYLGFFDTLFEVSSICWTSVISNIFLTSLNIRLSSSDDKVKLFKGISYSIILPLLLTLFPFYSNSYGPAQTHCSFDYVNYDLKTQFFQIIFIIFILGNVIYNIYVFSKVISFSKKTLKIISIPNPSVYNNILNKIFVINPLEYDEIIKYIRLYCLFPINLVISKLLEGLSRIIIYYEYDNIYIVYINSIIFCLNGFFNSIPSFFLFTGILKRKENEQIKLNESNINLSMTFI